jgi:hypothetical protein
VRWLDLAGSGLFESWWWYPTFAAGEIPVGNFELHLLHIIFQEKTSNAVRRSRKFQEVSMKMGNASIQSAFTSSRLRVHLLALSICQ